MPVTWKAPLAMKSTWMMQRKSLPNAMEKLNGLIITRDQCVQFPATPMCVALRYCPLMAGPEGF